MRFAGERKKQPQAEFGTALGFLIRQAKSYRINCLRIQNVCREKSNPFLAREFDTVFNKGIYIKDFLLGKPGSHETLFIFAPFSGEQNIQNIHEITIWVWKGDDNVLSSK